MRRLWLAVAAIVCFVLATISAFAASVEINEVGLIAFGLAFLTGALFIGG